MCDQGRHQAYVNRVESDLKQLALLGVTVIVASGDDGAMNNAMMPGNCPLDPSRNCAYFQPSVKYTNTSSSLRGAQGFCPGGVQGLRHARQGGGRVSEGSSLTLRVSEIHRYCVHCYSFQSCLSFVGYHRSANRPNKCSQFILHLGCEWVWDVILPNSGMFPTTLAEYTVFPNVDYKTLVEEALNALITANPTCNIDYSYYPGFHLSLCFFLSLGHNFNLQDQQTST